MPAQSQRGIQMPASPLRKLITVANERKNQGVHVYHLNIGQPDIHTPAEFFNAVEAFDQNPIEYANSQGVEPTIDAWRSYYETLGISLERNQLMITAGGSEALIFAFCMVADPGDEIVVFEPFYTNYNGYAALSGAQLRPVTLSIDNNFHLPSDEEIEAAITPKTKALLVCNPSNPTGTVFTAQELERLVNIAIKHDLFIIADEVYREFSFEAPVKNMLSFENARDRIIMIDSASKRFNVCGIRIGVLASYNTDIIATGVRFGMARLAVATLEQEALIPVLQKAPELIPPVVEEYRKRRDVVFEELSKIPGVVARKPEGAFYNICELPVDSSEKFAQWMIAEFEYEKETVLLAPAPGFYATPGKGEKEVRLAFVLECDQMKRALELLRRGLEEYNR